ncbi:MAG: glutathionylspermidine synthase family protein [Burkholderiales bacterium]|nr:glutathionylspermidine synthase family protein [Burkholderiales bacterium]
MRRERLSPRPGWQARCEAQGFHFHSAGGAYWDESACYALSAGEVDAIEAATAELHRVCLDACEHVVGERRTAELAIPEAYAGLVAESWNSRDPSLFGRFDLAWNGSGEPKMLEYNADTPTALLEASVAQWFWLQDVFPERDQFNSLHEKLIERWGELRARLPGGCNVHFACTRDHEEDAGNVDYLRDTAIQAGLRAPFLFIDEIGWSRTGRCFVDGADLPLEALFKLYPWEWMVRERFGPCLLERSCAMIEPAWKMMLSNKAVLALLWELNPGHPNLLPCYLDAGALRGADYVRKPILAREGANISLRRSREAMSSGGSYGAEGYVYQAYAPLAQFDGRHAVIGSWIVGEKPAGIGIREDDSPITRDTSRFVPHYFR